MASAFLRLRSAVEVVGCFTSGRQGIEAVAELQPDLVLLDLAMPEMNGFEVTRQIKASGSGTRIVILSFSDADGYKAAAVEAGAVGFINKMRFVDSFNSIVDEWLAPRL
jgi:DNA-binding NarL/FixJ family response regulator